MDEENQPINFSWWNVIKSFWYFAQEYRGDFVFWTSLLFGIYFFNLVPGFVIGKIVDFFVKYRTGDSLAPFYGYVLFLGIAGAVTSILRLYSKNKIVQIAINMNYFARVKGFEKLLDFSLKWHDSENTGNKAQRIQNGTQAIYQGSRLMQNDLFVVLTTVIGTLVAFLFLNPLYAGLVVAYACGFALVQWYFYARIKKLNDEKYKALERSSGTYYEGLSNVLTIKTLGVQNTFKKNIVNKEDIAKMYNSQLANTGILKWQVFQVFNNISFIIFLILTGQQVIAGLISVGTILIIYTYLNNLTDAASRSMDIIDQLMDVRAGIARMMPIYWDQEEDTHGTLSFPKQWESISITNASFNYRGSDTPGKTALEQLNFSIKKYQKIGIVGKSGSGKSTLAKLLIGLYSLDTGEYRIGNTNFYDLKHNEITKNITLVLQDSEMFNLSLKENITLLKNIDADLFTAAIQAAQLEEMVKKLPEGLETLIGEKGYRLSGGERQRIGLARAICKNPQILILDESTSSLDTKTEELIQQGLEKNLQGKTMIIIAHRVSTLRNVDKIYVFDQGEIIEEGTFAKLHKDKTSKFNAIYQSQNK